MIHSIQQQFSGNAGDLYPWIFDDSVTDILINGTQTAFIEKDGTLYEIRNPFHDEAELRGFCERLLIPMGFRLDAIRPYADGRLLDGSRFHITSSSIAVSGTTICIRKKRPYAQCTLETFAESGVTEFLRKHILEKSNLLICGGTGSGKTTLLTRLLDETSEDERIILLEETSEIETQRLHCIRFEARPPSTEGIGEVTLGTLLKNSLRMRPDRIVLGECRGAEAFDMIQAMNTGHRGSLGTIHASSSLDALKRLESLVLLSGIQLPHRVVRQWIGANIDLVIFLERQAERRRITEILQISGLEGENYRMTPVFSAR